MKYTPLFIIVALLSGCASVTPEEKRAMARGIVQFLSEAPEQKPLKDILFPLPE